MKKILILFLISFSVFSQNLPEKAEEEKLLFQNPESENSKYSPKEGNAVSENCQPNATNDCGGIGGNNYNPPTISASLGSICISKNNENLNNTVSVLTAAGCNTGVAQHVAWFRQDGTGIGYSTSKTKNIGDAGIYYARCVDSQGNIQSIRSNMVTVVEYSTPASIPLISVSPSTTIFEGELLTLHATGCNNSTFWENMGLGENVIDRPSNNTTFKAFCNNEVCKGNPASVLVTVLKPTISATGNKVCFNINTGNNTPLQLSVSNCNGTVIWMTGNVGTPLSVEPSHTTTYHANCQLASGALVPTNLFTVFVTDKPTVTKTVEDRFHFRLNAACSPGNAVLWSTGAVTNSIVVSSSITQEYTAYCSENGCYSKGTKKKIYAAPEISSNFPKLCEGQTLTLTAVGCDGTVSWFSGTGTTVLSTENPFSFVIRDVFNPTVFTYKARCTVGVDASPYSGILSVNINTGTIPESPAVSSNPNPALINFGKNITLSASGCPKFQTFWNTGENLTSITKTPEETTTYFAYCFNGTCPSGVSNKLVTVVDVPPPTIVPSARVVCAGQIAHLDASGCGGTVNWWSIPEANLEASPTNHGTGSSANVSISESRLFYATCNNLGVISDNSEIYLISYSPNPQVNSIPDPSVIWEGQNIELVANGCRSGDTYLWESNETTQSISKIETHDIYHTAKCLNPACSTNGTAFFVRVCPLLVTLTSPENDYKITPLHQPGPAINIVATNTIVTDVIQLKTNVIYQANNSIILEPGFQAEKNSIFTAQIGGCFIPSSGVSGINNKN